MTNKTIDSWDSFTGSNFLKAVDVAGEDDAFAVIDVEIFQDDSDNSSSAKPRLTLEKSGSRYFFDLNVTNSNFCKEHGISAPKQMIGKKIFFRKIMVTSPKTKKEVESLRISKIE